MNRKTTCSFCGHREQTESMLRIGTSWERFCSQNCMDAYNAKKDKEAEEKAPRKTKKKSKTKTKDEKEYLDNVAALGCIACAKMGIKGVPAEIHHIRDGAGTGQRNSHFLTIPLCPEHHRSGPDAIHQDKSRFTMKFGRELDLLATVYAALKRLKQI